MGKRSFKKYGVPQEIDLTVKHRGIVSRSPKQNRLWLIISWPFRILGNAFYWVLESEPKKSTSKRFKKLPPDLS